jgi:hypothetical protein
MTREIKPFDPTSKPIQDTSTTLPRVDPVQVAEALGAEPSEQGRSPTQPLPHERWTWDVRRHPVLAQTVADLRGPAAGLEWCAWLEAAAQDEVVGKVLCVCAAAAVARAVLAVAPLTPGERKQSEDALHLLSQWIDDPTDERFERICALIFGRDYGLHGAVWWALRTATSSVGNDEASWALASTCRAATSAGFNSEQLRAIVRRELMFRQHPPEGMVDNPLPETR